MIALLRGRLVHREAGRGIVDVGGVGYEVSAPASALEAWARAEGPVEVHVSTQVREDAFALFAFPTPAERACFQVLVGVSGIGPKLALACLDTLSVDALSRAVEAEDAATLARVPGVGKKTAQRLALELKGRLPQAAFVPQGPTPAPNAPSADPLVAALAKLGYSRAEIERVGAWLAAEGPPADAPVAERLRAALRRLYRSEA